MAAVAICVRRREGVVVPHVAVGAGHDLSRRGHLMRTRQRPACGAVIECRRGPGDGVMACRAVRCRKGRSG